MRSKLFVPGARPELFGKALASAADAISIDLEDAVVEARKGEARAAVAEFLRSSEAQSSSKSIIVRVNALATAHFSADARVIAAPSLGLVNLPKIESALEVDSALAMIDRAFVDVGLRPTLRVLANIESPKGLRNAVEIAAHPRVAGLQLGYADLFGPFGIERRDPQHVYSVMFAARMAAAEAGVFVYDGAFPDIKDTEGFRAEAGMARRLGFLGKSCIHPSQVALANEVFRPGAAEIQQAQRLLAAARTAAVNGAGAFLLDGRMIDTPDIRRAELVVASGRQD
ncbi:HpcH/HpaI aldolase/citrate lyase family protein [Steroidobacter flavus]|uniref:HpcH/HpaI aldolase/citrate lyase family protein n=1 Tax=Steroidobacter flavus TaxID=1842136 RepID=A0ABV8SQZ6_9GAMM